MKISVPKEERAGERRVAVVPETVARLRAKGVDLAIQAGAGVLAGYDDDAYREAGAAVVPDAKTLLGEADLVVQINTPTPERIRSVREGATWMSLLFPLSRLDLVEMLRERRLNAIALDRIPRITIAQSMDVLSSQSTCAGYAAVITAAAELPKMFPLLMTAAGRSDPAHVVVLGAGVAGLQAIAIARRLGAVVEAYDVRKVVKEQIESLGAKFIEVEIEEDAEAAGGYAKEVSEEAQRRAAQAIGERLQVADVCITTALIPGRPAPRLVTKEMVGRMKRGAVIVDLAAEQGGNCELTKADERVEVGGVSILGPTNLPSTVSFDASHMFSRNVEKLILYLLHDGRIDFDFDKEIVRGCVVTYEGKVADQEVSERIAQAAS